MFRFPVDFCMKPYEQTDSLKTLSDKAKCKHAGGLNRRRHTSALTVVQIPIVDRTIFTIFVLSLRLGMGVSVNLLTGEPKIPVSNRLTENCT